MPRARRVTGQDVAQRAGVSRATVSYVLNDAPGQTISAETRARVLDAVADLGYTPDAAARQLRTGVSDLILLALPPWPISHAFTLCVSAFTQRLSELGYTALVGPATEDLTRLEQTLARVQPVALIASGEHLTEPFVTRLRSAGTRAVLAFGDRPLGFVPAVVFDQSAVTRAAMDHLAARDHHVVLAVMPADPALQWFRVGRQSGAIQAAEQHAMELTVVESELDHGQVADVIAGTLFGDERPDAILAYNDDYALLVIRSLVDVGVRVPEDVAVIGCDNLPVSELFTPRLTTVDVDMSALGTEIADTLHQILCTGEAADVVPAPHVVVRDSA
jgi:DNA-binding LacI/PurR family transcriptional regulator